MRNESQHNGDGSFKSILQQRSNPPSEYDRTDVRRAPGSDYATAGCFALAAERNAFTKALPLTLRVLSFFPPLPDQKRQQGKLNQFFQSGCSKLQNATRVDRLVISLVKTKLGLRGVPVEVRPARLGELVQSKR